jgi:hypothetical protein
MNACSKLTSRNVFTLRRSSDVSECQNGALRQGFASPLRALVGCAPFRPGDFRDERLRREHFTVYMPTPNLQNLTYTTS